jgi:hypothetical protein
VYTGKKSATETFNIQKWVRWLKTTSYWVLLQLQQRCSLCLKWSFLRTYIDERNTRKIVLSEVKCPRRFEESILLMMLKCWEFHLNQFMVL